MIYKAKKKENIYDICNKFYGSLEFLNKILLENPNINIFDNLLDVEIFINDNELNRLNYNPQTGISNTQIRTKYDITEISSYDINTQYYMYLNDCQNDGELVSNPYKDFLIIANTNNDASYPKDFIFENLSQQDFTVVEIVINQVYLNIMGLYLNKLGMEYNYKQRYFYVIKNIDEDKTFNFRLKSNDNFSNYDENFTINTSKIYASRNSYVNNNGLYTQNEYDSVFIQGASYSRPEDNMDFESYEVPTLASRSIPNNLELSKGNWYGSYGLFRNFPNQIMFIIHENKNIEIDHFPTFNLKRTANDIDLTINKVTRMPQDSKKYHFPELIDRFELINTVEERILDINNFQPSFKTLLISTTGLDQDSHIDFIWNNALYRQSSNGNSIAFSQNEERIFTNDHIYNNTTVKFLNDGARFQIYDYQKGNYQNTYEINSTGTTIFNETAHIIEVDTQGQPSSIEYTLNAGGYTSPTIAQDPETIETYVFLQSNSIVLDVLPTPGLIVRSFIVDQVEIYDSGEVILPKSQKPSFKNTTPNFNFKSKETITLNKIAQDDIIFFDVGGFGKDFKIEYDGNTEVVTTNTKRFFINNAGASQNINLYGYETGNYVVNNLNFNTNLYLEETALSNIIDISATPLENQNYYIIKVKSNGGGGEEIINLSINGIVLNFVVNEQYENQIYFVNGSNITQIESDNNNGFIKIESINEIDEAEVYQYKFIKDTKIEFDRYYPQNNYKIEMDSSITGDLEVKVNDSHIPVAISATTSPTANISNEQIDYIQVFSKNDVNHNIQNIRLSEETWIYKLDETYQYNFNNKETHGNYNGPFLTTALNVNRNSNTFEIYTNTERHTINCSDNNIFLDNIDLDSTTKDITLKGNSILNSIHVYASGSAFDPAYVKDFVEFKLKENNN